MQRVTLNLGASSGEPFHCTNHLNLRFRLKVRHKKENKSAIDLEKSPSHGPSKHFKPLHLNSATQKSRRTQNCAIQNLEGRTMHVVGTSLPENQNATAQFLLLGLSRWERRLVCLLQSHGSRHER